MYSNKIHGTQSRGRLMFSASTALRTESVPEVRTERSSKPKQQLPVRSYQSAVTTKPVCSCIAQVRMYVTCSSSR